MAVKLAVVDIAWYSPIPAFSLITAMGYMRSSVDVPMPKEYKYPWIIQVALKKSDGGRSAKDREEYVYESGHPLQRGYNQRHPVPPAEPIRGTRACSQPPR